MARTKIDDVQPKVVDPIAPVVDAPSAPPGVTVAETGMGDTVIPLVNPTPTSPFKVETGAPPKLKKYRVLNDIVMGMNGCNVAFRVGQIVDENFHLDAMRAAGVKLQEV